MRRYRYTLLFVLLGAPGSATVAHAQTLRSVFDEANRFASEGECEQALELYKNLIDRGVDDADLHYNHGVCFAQLAQWGRATWHFELAQRLRPQDTALHRERTRLRQHIASLYAEEAGEARIASGPSFVESLLAHLSENALALCWFVFELVFVAVLLVLVAGTRQARTLLISRCAISALACAICVWSLGAKRNGWGIGKSAIVLDDRVVLREGPNSSALGRDEVRGGVYVRVLDRYGDYNLIGVPGGAQGWTHRQHLGAL